MRLTLRTMLAYMDGILEPADAADVKAKIDASEFATELMHKAREVVKRQRLAAPQLEGRGIGLDPNTVAEYLDNTLTSERVPDFEKVCLESDVHLAEVASCHQILALVLGEPAEVDSRARQRMYALVNRVASEEQTAATVAAATPATATPIATAVETAPAAASVRKTPEVPDYLREAVQSEPKSGGLVGMLVSLLLVALLGAGVGTMLAFPELFQQWFGRGQVADSGPAEVEVLTDVPPEVTLPEPTGPDGAAPVATPPDTTDVPRAIVDNTPPPAPADMPAPPLEQPAVTAEPSATDTAATARPALPDLPPAAPPATTTPVEVPPAAPEAQPPAAMPVPAPTDVATSTPPPAPVPPLPNEAPIPPPPATPAVGSGPAATDTPPAAPAAPAPEGLGRKIADQNVLLRWDPQTSTWLRFGERAPLVAGDVMLSLPGYRSKLVMASGITIDALGGTLFTLEGPNAQGVPGLNVTRGKLILASAGAPNAQLRVRVGTAEATLALLNADATVAIDVRQPRVEGTDPEKPSGPLIAEVYVTGGQIGWSAGPAAEPMMVQGPARREMLANGELSTDTAPALSFPDWITIDDRSPLDRQTADTVQQNLRGDRAVSLSLKEMVGDRKMEVSIFALKCLAQIGEFDDFIPPLRDPTQRANWKAILDTLFAAIDYSPETAARIRQAFERQGPRGTEMYRMLWGYTDEQLKDGAAASLVDFLDHPELDMRVVSFWTLQRITGASYLYQPHDSEVRRRPSVQRWRQRLEQGAIVHKAE